MMNDLGATAIPRTESPFASTDDVPNPPTTKSSPDTNKIIAALTRSYAALGIGMVGVSKVNNNDAIKQDGILIVSSAEELAESWRMLLDNDPKVRRALKKMVESSGWSSVIIAHGALIMSMLKENHPDAVRHLVRRKTTTPTI